MRTSAIVGVLAVTLGTTMAHETRLPFRR